MGWAEFRFNSLWGEAMVTPAVNAQAVIVDIQQKLAKNPVADTPVDPRYNGVFSVSYSRDDKKAMELELGEALEKASQECGIKARLRSAPYAIEIIFTNPVADLPRAGEFFKAMHTLLGEAVKAEEQRDASVRQFDDTQGQQLHNMVQWLDTASRSTGGNIKGVGDLKSALDTIGKSLNTYVGRLQFTDKNRLITAIDTLDTLMEAARPHIQEAPSFATLEALVKEGKDSGAFEALKQIAERQQRLESVRSR